MANKSGTMSAPPKLTAWHKGQSVESSERLFGGAFTGALSERCMLLATADAIAEVGLP